MTTRDASGRNHGITINAVTSLALDPALMVICLDKGSNTLRALLESCSFCLHFLGAHQEHLSRAFAIKDDDRFGQIPFEVGLHGSPILGEVVAAGECWVEAHHPGGDHTIIVASVLRVQVSAGKPLLFHRGRYVNLEPEKLAA